MKTLGYRMGYVFSWIPFFFFGFECLREKDITNDRRVL